MKKLTLLAAILATAIIPAKAVQTLFITEVDPNGSGNTAYAADWFELTNTGTSALDITGWKMDDSHATPSTHGVPLSGITSIPAGGIVVFVESTGTTASAVDTAFENAWFGSISNVPAGFLIANYSGSGIGLSNNGDAVNIYNSSNALQAGVSFGNAPSGGKTFDNSAKLNGTAISTASIVGLDGAFTSGSGAEVGSPGFNATAVPEPSTGTVAFVMVALTGAFAVKRHRSRLQA